MKTKKTYKYLFIHPGMFGGPVIRMIATYDLLKKYKRLHYHGDDFVVYKAKGDEIVQCDMRG